MDKKLKECSLITTKEYNIYYCLDGRMILTNIKSNKMKYLRLPSALVDIINQENFFKIMYNDEKLLAIIGKQVHSMSFKETDDNIELDYLFDLSSIIDSNSIMSINGIRKLMVSDSKTYGVISTDIVRLISDQNQNKLKGFVNELRFFTINS